MCDVHEKGMSTASYGTARKEWEVEDLANAVDKLRGAGVNSVQIRFGRAVQSKRGCERSKICPIKHAVDCHGSS